MTNWHDQLTGDELHPPAHTISGVDPGAVGAGHFWIDTQNAASGWVIKIRNAANDDWVTAVGVTLAATLPETHLHVFIAARSIPANHKSIHYKQISGVGEVTGPGSLVVL